MKTKEGTDVTTVLESLFFFESDPEVFSSHNKDIYHIRERDRERFPFKKAVFGGVLIIIYIYIYIVTFERTEHVYIYIFKCQV